jgi:hypothetical protein
VGRRLLGRRLWVWRMKEGRRREALTGIAGLILGQTKRFMTENKTIRKLFHYRSRKLSMLKKPYPLIES